MEQNQNTAAEIQSPQVSTTDTRGTYRPPRAQQPRSDGPVQVFEVTSTIPFSDRRAIEIIERLLE